MYKEPSNEVKIAVLEEKLSIYEQMLGRIDLAIEKIGETSYNISQMLAIHTEKIEQCNRTDSIIVTMIEDMKKSSREQHDEMSKLLGMRIENVEKELKILSQFKWKAVGAFAFIVFLFSTIPVVTPMLTEVKTDVIIEKVK